MTAQIINYSSSRERDPKHGSVTLPVVKGEQGVSGKLQGLVGSKYRELKFCLIRHLDYTGMSLGLLLFFKRVVVESHGVLGFTVAETHFLDKTNSTVKTISAGLYV